MSSRHVFLHWLLILFESQVLQSVLPIKDEEVVLGQYEGYRDDPTVPDKSNTPTFATVILRIHNERWEGTIYFTICLIFFWNSFIFEWNIISKPTFGYQIKHEFVQPLLTVEANFIIQVYHLYSRLGKHWIQGRQTYVFNLKMCLVIYSNVWHITLRIWVTYLQDFACSLYVLQFSMFNYLSKNSHR